MGAACADTSQHRVPHPRHLGGTGQHSTSSLARARRSARRVNTSALLSSLITIGPSQAAMIIGGGRATPHMYDSSIIQCSHLVHTHAHASYSVSHVTSSCVLVYQWCGIGIYKIVSLLCILPTFSSLNKGSWYYLHPGRYATEMRFLQTHAEHDEFVFQTERMKLTLLFL